MNEVFTGNKDKLKHTRLLDFKIITSQSEFLTDEIVDSVLRKEKWKTIICANPYAIARAMEDKTIFKALEKATWLIPDGAGIAIALWFRNKYKKVRRISGPDLFLEIANKINEKDGKTIFFFLGSTPQTLRIIKNKFRKEFPNIKVKAYSPPFKEKFSDSENEAILKAVNLESPDILWVGIGSPKQEKWIEENRYKINASIIGGIGAAFDFYAGSKKRAPIIIRFVFLEWLWRLILEPRRLWKRTIIYYPKFLWYFWRSILYKK